MVEGEAGDVSVFFIDAGDGAVGVNGNAVVFEAFYKSVKEQGGAAFKIAHAAFGLSDAVQAVPDPCGGDGVVVVSEFQGEERVPDDVIGAAAKAVDEPGFCGEFIELGPFLAEARFECEEAEADALREGDRRKTEQVEGGGEGIQFSVVVEAGACAGESDKVFETEFAAEREVAGVGLAKEVIEVFEREAVEVEGSDQSADRGFALENCDVVAAFSQGECGA